ncbi:hypothetical protein WA026_015571 [Henosepilachna vigintioctopunctata]|uniref:Uncharacterized protein n=1 Tax=Henosepilachna vigintioctopunctata TaxID=420089 RepID=A0AAW1VF69_9CUCU
MKIDLEAIKTTEYVPPPEKNMNGHYSHNISHQKQTLNHGRTSGKEWENPVNERTKLHHRPAMATTSHNSVPAPTQNIQDASSRRRRPSSSAKLKPTGMDPSSRSQIPLRTVKNKTQVQKSNFTLPKNDKSKGIVYQSAAACYVGTGVPTVSSGVNNCSVGGVYGVYSETKYTFAVNGLPGNLAQASAAAAFFAR